MLRDVKRRKLTAEYAHERARYGALVNNNILPEDLRVSFVALFFIIQCYGLYLF